jgi:uncharacterized protein YjbJ (UPF0337 family)
VAVEKNAISKIDEFAGRAVKNSANFGRLTCDKGLENRGKLEQAKSRIETSAHKFRDKLT